MNEELFRLSPYLVELRDKLILLPFWKVIAFSVSFCERLSPFYRSISNDLLSTDVEIFNSSLDLLWKSAVLKSVDKEKLEQLKEAIAEMDLDYETVPYYDELIEFADALYTCLEGVIENSVSDLTVSSNKTMDTIVFRYIDNEFSQNNIDYDIEKIESHPLMERERELHILVLNYLEEKDELTMKDIKNLSQIVNNVENSLINLVE
jgi:uncharacterized protein YjaG (DUF416 family)